MVSGILPREFENQFPRRNSRGHTAVPTRKNNTPSFGSSGGLIFLVVLLSLFIRHW